MNRTFSQLSELVISLREEQFISFRCFLYKHQDAWKLHSLFVDILKETAPSINFSFIYDEHAFFGGEITGAEVADWLLESKGEINSVHFTLPKMQENVHSHQYESDIKMNFWGVKEPHSIHEIYSAEKDELKNIRKVLVFPKNPSFFNVTQAVYWFLYDEEIVKEDYRVHHGVIVREKHDDAWLKSIHFDSGHILIVIEGKNVAGVRLEVRGGDNLSVDCILKKSGLRKFPIPKTLPKQILVIISRGRQCLDYRHIDLRYDKKLTASNSKSTDVTAEISGLISQGENETVEFKEQLNSENDKYLKTVAAFANGKGGVLLFGVKNDGSIIGYDTLAAIENLKTQITNSLRDKVADHPNFHFKHCQINSKFVLALYIEAGESHPYGVFNRSRLNCYVRKNSSTFPATQQEVRRLARATLYENISDSPKFPFY